MLSNREKDKIDCLKNELKKRLAGTTKESVFFSLRELARIPLLSDQMGLEKILNIIQEGSKGKITWREVIGQTQGPVSASDPYPVLLAPSRIGIEIHVDDISKIDEFFNMVLESQNKGNLEITSLHFNKNQDSSHVTVIINERYADDKLKPLVTKGRWKVLLEVAENGSAYANSIKEAKSITNYFNTNRKCNIYTTYPEYKLTKILKEEGQEILPNISIKIIPTKAFSQRKKKLLKIT
jgi:hypothetical protein